MVENLKNIEIKEDKFTLEMLENKRVYLKLLKKASEEQGGLLFYILYFFRFGMDSSKVNKNWA